MLTFKRMVSLVYILIMLLFCGCSLLTVESNIPHPPEATVLPNFSGEITDIRVQAAGCKDYQLDLSQYHDFKDKTLLQIQYGYFMDGQWYDIPSENYELKGIFSNAGTNGMSAVPKSHLVRIGPYLLICHVLHTNAPNSECIISDTLGTQVQEPFEYYFTPYIKQDDDPGYALLTIDRRSILEGEELRYVAYGVFGQYYYLMLEIDEIPDDYELHITDHTWSENYDNVVDYVLTKSDILELID